MGKKNQSDIVYYPVADLEELSVEGRLFIDIGDLPVVIFKIGDQVFAIEDRCSHDHNPLGEGDLDHFQVICPRHGARFDVQTGKALTLPAVEDIQVFPIRINGSTIEIGVKE